MGVCGVGINTLKINVSTIIASNTVYSVLVVKCRTFWHWGRTVQCGLQSTVGALFSVHFQNPDFEVWRFRLYRISKSDQTWCLWH